MKIKLFTHNDLDGYGCVIVAKKFYSLVNYEALDYNLISGKLQECISSGEIDKYDKIYITDISPDSETAEILNKYADKICLIDHHPTAEHLNRYSWSHVDIGPDSATYLFFKYLNHELGDTGSTDDIEFFQTISQYDTWQWTTNGNRHPYLLNLLFRSYGGDRFVQRFAGGSKSFTESEIFHIDMLEESATEYIDSIMNTVRLGEYNGYKVGFAFSDMFASEIGNDIARLFLVDFAVVISLRDRRVSLRTRREDLDLGKLAAEHFNGGGHKKAAGFVIPDLTSDILKLFGFMV